VSGIKRLNKIDTFGVDITGVSVTSFTGCEKFNYTGKLRSENRWSASGLQTPQKYHENYSNEKIIWFFCENH